MSPSSEFARWRANGLQGSFAPTVIARLEDIVRYIADDDPATASTFAMHLLDRAELLSGSLPRDDVAEISSSLRDPDDNPILSAAVAYHCKFLVTGDDDLLELKSFSGVEIVSAAPLMRSLPRDLSVTLTDLTVHLARSHGSIHIFLTA